MDAEQGDGVKDGTMTEDLFNTETSSITDNVKETVPADKVASHHDEESLKTTEETPYEDAVASEKEENLENGLPDMNQNLDEKEKTVTEQPIPNDRNSSDEDGLHGGTNAQRETEDEAEKEPAPADKKDTSIEEYKQLVQELTEQRDKARERSSQLQVKLVEYLSRQDGQEAQVEVEKPESEQLQEYQQCLKVLSELRQQMKIQSELFKQQEEELKAQTREKLDKVENEWREFMALKQDVAVSVLSRRIGKQAAQAKVEAILAAEQNRQDELIKLRLKYLKLKFKIQRLEAELRDGDKHKDPLQIQFEILQAERLQQRKQMEKQNEESLKIEKKISSGLEVLSNVKEKLFWSRMEVKAKREQLAEVEATLARKRATLTRMKKSQNKLQRDNARLQDRRGLIGNTVLLRDYEDTVDACQILEEKLEKLKGRHAKVVFNCGRK